MAGIVANTVPCLALALGLLVLAPVSSHAEEPSAAHEAPPAEKEKEKERNLFFWEGRVDWRLSHTVFLIADSDANPGNRYLLLPQHSSLTSLRAEIHAGIGSQWRFVLKPRLAVRVTQTSVDGVWQTEKTSFATEFLEAYAVWRITDFLSASYGLRHVWWSPAEALSPTNRLFHETHLVKSPTTLYRGRWLAHVTTSLRRNLTAEFMLETRPNGNIDTYAAGESFEQTGLVLLRYGFGAGSGSSHVGFVAGRGERSRPWVGEYVLWSLTDAFSVYADVSHTRGSRAWYPFEREGMLGFEQGRRHSQEVVTFAVAGMRHEVKDVVDARLEYIFNQAGYTHEEFQLAVRTVHEVAPEDPSVVDPYESPGLDVTGRAYLFLSLRIRGLGPPGKLLLHPRYVLSLTDSSGLALLGFEWQVTPTWTLFLFSGAAVGARDQDLTRGSRAHLQVVTKFSW
ncbi:hypothetical protein [Vitiosangium sp. GDMCC 1.1324]|uniref:hypothetical protein n=1 Tax=Vitiosangium sp. (strain GDMCC 1.1324) TaxID=2138576 RepID=UPI000D3BA61F|nr:hypothetical protein [Vitiosangium sp. GDMCC 1.1324]PTL85854.1 hypothetical protein DAT35_03950 [Vitiosangium sp. GDMCC 1.1324]